ncbi:MAG TPA: type 2 lanthipeptide synthetase LanM family protein [Rhizomicrobium sp.]|nr:type 2 lanthipeptide synthetase LanM family protein [Rhizomicrobium sp.]
MTSSAGVPHFDASLGCLTAPHLDALAAGLADIPDLAQGEAGAILEAAREALTGALHPKVARLLLLELNAARVEKRLAGDTPEARWDDFIATTRRREFWDALAPHYPTLAPRIETLLANRCGAMLEFARRWAADRAKLSSLVGKPPGALTRVSFGAGDAHRGGHTVALVACESGRVAYKPRSAGMEEMLAAFLADMEQAASRGICFAVPAVVDRGSHGWAAFVEHAHAANPGELKSFYTGIGQALAAMRLLSGMDFHSENIIAHRGAPVLVDCETLFTPKIRPFPSGFGDATDRAMRLISGTVLATGLLPGRGQGLGWRGVDVSGVGALAGEQPAVMLPDIVDAGTDRARFGLRPADVATAQNHPAAEPSLGEYWPQVLEGFEALSADLRALDARGALAPLLARFSRCQVRTVLRATEVYAELSRMLWHPVSLHKEAEARARARDLLGKMAVNVAGAPGDPAIIDAEIDALEVGDIPYFAGLASEGVLEGPGGHAWLEPRNLVEDALEDWRAADLSLERKFIHAALVSAYVGEVTPQALALWPKAARRGPLDARRRAQAARIMRMMVEQAIRGPDGTAAWMAPTLTPGGWSVQALGADLYGGISGLAVLAGAYLKEQKAGRADPVEGLEDLFGGILRTMDGFEEKREANKTLGMPVRPQTPSCYLGMGAQICARLFLAAWGLDAQGVRRAARLGRDMPETVKSDETRDVLSGRPGAIPALLALHRVTGDESFVAMAREMGDDLCDSAVIGDGRAKWLFSRWPEGIGGFAHGVTGVGWALFLLARATQDERYLDTASAAFAFEDSLFNESDRTWLDKRKLGGPKSANAWCHGSVGIGLARLDLDPLLVDARTRRALHDAAAATWAEGMGWSHCLCHGDAGAWELLDNAIAHGEGPKGVTREEVLAKFVTSLEDNGPVSGIMKDAFVPGLFPGIGGIAYQLLKAHPKSGLPSLMTLGGSDLERCGIV